MRSIETRVTVAPDGTLSVTTRAPDGVPPGEHPAVVVIDESSVGRPSANAASESSAQTVSPLDFPVGDYGPWPAGMSLRREDLYDDRGR